MNRMPHMRKKYTLYNIPGSVSTTETLREGFIRNRSLFSLAIVPLALLGITCGFSVVQRATASITQPTKYGQVFGNMSEQEARQAAIALCSKVTDGQATAKEVSRQCAYSWRRQTMVREWNVTCDSPEGQYLIRINADTRRVYAINRLDAPPAIIADGKTAPSPASPPLTEPIIISRSLAEVRAKEYLQIVGIPLQGLKQLDSSSARFQTEGSPDAIPQWNFTFRRSVPGLGERLLKVSINGETGGLEHVWNPVFAM